MSAKGTTWHSGIGGSAKKEKHGLWGLDHVRLVDVESSLAKEFGYIRPKKTSHPNYDLRRRKNK